MLVRMAYLTSLEYNFKFSKTVNYEGFRLIKTEVFIPVSVLLLHYFHTFSSFQIIEYFNFLSVIS